MKQGALTQHWWIAVLVAFLGGKDASANSYAYARMPKENLPKSVRRVAHWDENVSVWKGYAKLDNEGRMIPEPGAIERFFAEGTWFDRDPYQVHYDELKQNSGISQEIAWRILADPKSVGMPERLGEFEAFRKKGLALMAKYQRWYGSSGAVTDKNGEIFIWKLQSPQVLRVEGRGGLCYLELSDEKAVKLLRREPGTPKAPKIPALPRENLRITRDFLPPVGRHSLVDRKILAAFLSEGKRVDIEIPGRELLDQRVSTHWFGEDGFHLSERSRESTDRAGNVILGGGPAGYGSFASVFTDAVGKLWRARVLSDAYLQLDDGKDLPFILVHPVVLAEGNGQLSRR